MVVERRSDLSELLQQLGGVVAEVGEHRPQAGGDVALAEQEPVAVRPLWLLRPQSQRVVIECREYLGARERARVVPDAGLLDEIDGPQADPVRAPGQLG